MERPSSLIRSTAVGQQPCGLARRGDIEAIQRDAESAAERLDVGFLSRPVRVEPFLTAFNGCSCEGCTFGSREETARQLVVLDGPDLLDIDADRRAARESEQPYSVRMSDV